MIHLDGQPLAQLALEICLFTAVTVDKALVDHKYNFSKCSQH